MSKKLAASALAAKTGFSLDVLEAIEAGEYDPTAGMLETIAGALDIPPSWLYGDPRHLALLLADLEEERVARASWTEQPDPILDRILSAARQDRELFVLLTRLLHADDPKLLKAAEVSLRSLVKQSRQATVPWESRPPGHFEPPSD